MIRVTIADDHAVVRKGLSQIIAESSDMTVLDEASNGQEVLEKVAQAVPDVLVLDISMPIRNGLEVLQEVRQLHPNLPVLILSMYPEDQYAMRVLNGGAAGYMNKETALEHLPTAIRKVFAGGKYISSALAEKLTFELNSGLRTPPHEKLSERESHVLKMIGAGKPVSEIADELMLSTKTVSTYRSRVLEKLNLKTNADLIRYALENNLA
jgi:two-component system, NarL family, invasion response regulator UvrY